MKTKIIPLIIALLMALAPDANARYRGDLNGDDRVDLADMVFLAKAIKSGSADKSLDVNASGSVDDYDLHKLADIIILKTLSEDSGFNVGIGGWDDSGEDFGGTLNAPAFTTRSAGDIRFYMNSPKKEGDDRYSMEFGITEGNEAPSAIIFNIRLPREMRFDSSKIVELEQALKASHSLYGTPRFVKENEDDEWSEYSLRFIIMSPELTAFPNSKCTLGRIFYSVGDCWGSPMFTDCQTASAGDGVCTMIPEHWADYNGNFKPVEVSSVWFDQSEMNLIEGDEGWLYANIDPWNASDQSLTWSSSDENVAVVIISEDGRNANVKAIKEGESIVKATSSNGLSASCTIRVEKRIIEVWGVYLSQDNLNMIEGDVVTLSATIDPSNATDQSLTWSSSDENVAVVITSEDGRSANVKAVGVGEANITVTSSNGITATCSLTVAPRIIEVTSITLNNTELTLTEGDVATLVASIQPADATDKTLSWTSSDMSVATVSQTGEVKAVKVGTSTITVTASNGISANCFVTVKSGIIGVTEVILDKTNLELTEGDTALLTATVTPADATDKTLTWTSSNEEVVSVSSAGEVKAIKAGKATVTVSSSNGKTAVCEVVVLAKEIKMESISLDAEELALIVGDKHQFVATVYPAETTYPDLEWWVEDEKIASIDQNGLVTMTAEGVTVVHVRSVRWNDVEAVCRLNVSSSVEGIIEENAPCDIFSIDGKPIMSGVHLSDISNLRHGVYIIRQDGKTTKLLK